MDTPIPWLLAGTVVGLALAYAGRTVQRRLRDRRIERLVGARRPAAGAGEGLTTVMADSQLRDLSPRSPGARRARDPARAAARAAAREQAARVIAAEAARVQAEREAAARRGPPHVLVVDDSTTIRLATGSLLERQGWRVTYAVDGMEALLRVSSELPDAVVTDIEMPRMDGLSLVRRLRAEPRTAALPVVVVSSALDRFHAEAAATGADALLAKPYEDEALLGPLRERLSPPARPTRSLSRAPGRRGSRKVD